MLALLAGANEALADEKEAWSVFVSDHAAPTITAIDAVSGEKIGTFPVKGPATLHRSASDRAVFAIQGTAGTVTAISSDIASTTMAIMATSTSRRRSSSALRS
ncbi:hypothetical protein MAXJ12_23537 [Mesorhizobium alhagi CCNWXJ12-2]|uniref:Uncharacterized protein n=1 Tax=Mesorhizobium alhagi CCNWXJ12-2 TaxID=1107882 RepID=H0HWZ0_9HYPH|nr:hypothetical protein MAXJ12_23537 [Mesorhizobium alhagi CCNWXJ12-2]